MNQNKWMYLPWVKYIMMVAAMQMLLWISYNMWETEEFFTATTHTITSTRRNIEQEYLERQVLPYSEEECQLLERLVEAEAGGEDMVGKILVCNVVLNRIASDEFPNTMESVIFQQVKGKYQFSPISLGTYDKVIVSEDSKEAVQRAFEGEDYAKGATYFVARAYANTEDVVWFDNNLTFLFIHGGHEFFR
ncbi:MAG: cell wall hydrolase [Eubacteriales bacterium]